MSCLPDQHPPLISEIRVRNLLSFGPTAEPISLGTLNVLIGPNGSGKSNFIEAIALLRAAASDLRAVTRRGGGVAEWIWKGAPGNIAHVDAVVCYPGGSQALRHTLEFSGQNQVFALEDERIEYEAPFPGYPEPYFFYRYQQGRPVLNVNDEHRTLAQETVEPGASILVQRKDPELYPEIYHLATSYERIRIYREWTFGRDTVFRAPQSADMRNDRLEEDFSNLGLFLNRLRRNPQAKNRVRDELRELYQGIDDFDVSIEGGTVQVFFTEGRISIPAPRLSDGTVRYLCLLAILCDPDPPPLVCIEEPELGLHPDVLPRVADLMVEASGRTQVLATTHSDIIVDALSSRPETVLVFEKHDAQTTVKRLNASDLSEWLERYCLGELWLQGELGGTRW